MKLRWQHVFHQGHESISKLQLLGQADMIGEAYASKTFLIDKLPRKKDLQLTRCHRVKGQPYLSPCEKGSEACMGARMTLEHPIEFLNKGPASKAWTAGRRAHKIGRVIWFVGNTTCARGLQGPLPERHAGVGSCISVRHQWLLLQFLQQECIWQWLGFRSWIEASKNSAIRVR